MASEAGQAWSCVAFGSVSFQALPPAAVWSPCEARRRRSFRPPPGSALEPRCGTSAHFCGSRLCGSWSCGYRSSLVARRAFRSTLGPAHLRSFMFEGSLESVGRGRGRGA